MPRGFYLITGRCAQVFKTLYGVFFQNWEFLGRGVLNFAIKGNFGGNKIRGQIKNFPQGPIDFGVWDTGFGVLKRRELGNWGFLGDPGGKFVWGILERYKREFWRTVFVGTS